MADLNVEYRKLVRAPANPQNLARTIGLVREVVRQRADVDPDTWDLTQIRQLWDVGPTREPEAATLRRFTFQGAHQFLLESPNWERDKTKEVVAALAFGSTIATERLEGHDYSLLADALLVLFHQSYFALLPRLEPKGFDRIALLRSYVYLSSLFSATADQFRIQGLVAIAIGDFGAAGKAFQAALSATHSDEHDFMTRLQALWMTMLEHGQYREALNLLVELYPKVARDDLGEFADLIRRTFDAAEAAKAPR